MATNGASGATSFTPANAADKVEFTLAIANPCRTTTLSTITVTGADSSSPYSKGVTDGTTGTVTFVRPTTTVETSTLIDSICGETSYTIHSSNAGANFSYNAAWAVITESAGTYTLTIDTTADLTLIANEDTVTLNLWIKATLDDYTGYTRESYTAVNIVISEITCVCTALAWDDPSSGVT